MTMKASRTYGSHYHTEYDQIMVPKMEGLFTAHELRMLQEDPKGTKAALNQLDEEWLHHHERTYGHNDS
jgi:hypothetical protein